MEDPDQPGGVTGSLLLLLVPFCRCDQHLKGGIVVKGF